MHTLLSLYIYIYTCTHIRILIQYAHIHRDDANQDDMLHMRKPSPKLTGSSKYRKSFDNKKRFVDEESEITSRRTSECSSTASHASRETTPLSPADQDKKHGKDGSTISRSPLRGRRVVRSPAQDENVNVTFQLRAGGLNKWDVLEEKNSDTDIAHVNSTSDCDGSVDGCRGTGSFDMPVSIHAYIHTHMHACILNMSVSIHVCVIRVYINILPAYVLYVYV
jgi:hypothetical protein